MQPPNDALPATPSKLLIIDDEREVCKVMADILRDEGYRVSVAHDAQTGMRLITKEMPEVCLLDVWLPDSDGLAILEKVRASGSDVSVIMISGHASIDSAVRATRLGAVDFLEKPLSLEKLVMSVGNALQLRSLRTENANLRNRMEKRYKLIGESTQMQQVRSTIDVIAAKNSTVLITGENGTGKENVARLIHEKSGRAAKPFVAINCAAIPEELIESELFGFEKGSFTGAHQSKRGKFEQANGGTLFLDEIGDMSLKVQAKVLRVLQDQRFERIGGDDSVEVDVRVLAATNKNLEDEIKKGTFREDLYYRLNVIPIRLPPLRERGRDIIALAEHYLAEFGFEGGGNVKKLTSEAEHLLTQYHWPGNIRELKNIMERLSIMVPSNVISAEQLPAEMCGGVQVQSGLIKNFVLLNRYKDAKAAFERYFILEKLRQSEFNISKTAELIGIERSHLYRKIKVFELESEIEKRAAQGLE
jgi:two-component system, NtrC family, nitrogen regulation response regulator NtrX